jgi:hypothetical protein
LRLTRGQKAINVRGGFLMWVEGSELLHDVGGDGCDVNLNC